MGCMKCGQGGGGRGSKNLKLWWPTLWMATAAAAVIQNPVWSDHFKSFIHIPGKPFWMRTLYSRRAPRLCWVFAKGSRLLPPVRGFYHHRHRRLVRCALVRSDGVDSVEWRINVTAAQAAQPSAGRPVATRKNRFRNLRHKYAMAGVANLTHHWLFHTWGWKLWIVLVKYESFVCRKSLSQWKLIVKISMKESFPIHWILPTWFRRKPCIWRGLENCKTEKGARAV